jgi:antibiotic biosynthesis monooxygenase (ABM) superfamily enzyme
MNKIISSSIPSKDGATAVIMHTVRVEKRAEYEKWLDKIGSACRASNGHLDLNLIRPVPGLTSSYTIIVRFDTRENLEVWMHSSTRTKLIDEAQALLVNGDGFFIKSGLDFWFTPEGAKARVPTRWKQFLVTWSAIFPLSISAQYILPSVFAVLGVPDHPILRSLIATGLIVILMVYLVMPRYTKLVYRWLFA